MSSIRTHLINFFRNNTLVVFLCAAILVGSTVGLGLVAGPTASAQCNDNYIIHCGVTSASGLMQAYNADPFVQHVYSSFGISSSDINGMGSTMTAGTVTKTGDVIVGGQTVATNAMTAGRQNIPGSTTVTSQGSTFYKRAPSVSFLQNSLSAWVVMKDGQFAFAVLPSCGNPVVATPKPKPKVTPQPSAVCKDLDVSKNGTTITATVTSTLKNGATYKTTTYDFGDGQTVTTPNTTVTHTYSQSGTFTITARQEFSTGMEQTVQPACRQTITISVPQKPTPTPTPPPTPTPTPPAPPTHLLSVGPGSMGTMFGIFGGTAALGTLGYRFHLLRKLHK